MRMLIFIVLTGLEENTEKEARNCNKVRKGLDWGNIELEKRLLRVTGVYVGER